MDISQLQPNLQKASRLMALLSNPARLHILCVLLEGEKSVLTLVDSVGLSQPSVSQHLKKLKADGLVETRRDAQTIYYRLEGEEAKSVLATLHELYCADH